MANNNAKLRAPQRLDPDALYRYCDPASLGFSTTDELDDPERGLAVGHERALEALDFGVRIGKDGFNVFVLGPSGSHRHAIVEDFLRDRTPEPTQSPDWCYVYNFEDERKPLALRLPPGRGSALRRDMQELVEELQAAIPAAFESE